MSSGFAQALEAVKDVEGWMTDAQARRVWESSSRVPPGGTIVEIGSYRGRSAIVLSRAAAEGVEVVAIDPHAGGDRGPREISANAQLGRSDHESFRRNLDRAGVAERVRHVRLASEHALGEVEGPVDLLYVDGAHRYPPARDDLAHWGARVRPGGRMLIHDSFSSIGVTLAILRLLVPSRSWRYVGRSGSLAEYVREPPGVTSALRQLAQLPWFARNVAIKVLLVLRLRPLTRLLGHSSGDWPY